MKKNLYMDDKKAAAILIGLFKKHSLNSEEKEALKSAIGILSWTSLSKSGIKRQREKLLKSVEW